MIDQQRNIIDRMIGQIEIMKKMTLTQQEMNLIQNQLDGISMIIHKVGKEELE